MPQVEIDEAELLRLRRTGEVIASMYKSPSAKRKLLEALKDVQPNDPAVKELEQPDPVMDRFAKLEKELADERKARADSDAEREKNSKLDTIRREQDEAFAELRRQKWTDAGIAKVKETMEEKGVLDVMLVARALERDLLPQPEIAMPGGSGGWNFADALATESDADLKRLIDTKGENEGLLRKMAGEAIAEVRGVTGARR